jgi:heptosyltransferase-2
MHGRILIAQTAFLGDVVLSTPLMQAIRDRWPRAYVAAMVRPPAVSLLEGLPFLDAVLVDHPQDQPKTARWTHILRALRGQRFDLAVSPSRSLRVGLLLLAAGIRRRVGYRLGLNRWLYTDIVERRADLHIVERERELLRPFGGMFCEYPLAVAQATSLAPDLERVLGQPAARRVAIAPGSTWATKRWSPEGYAWVASQLAVQGVQVYLIGSGRESPVVDEVARGARAAVNLCGRTTLPELAAILGRCDLIIANDSGPAHIAGAVGTPVVVIYGASTLSLGYGPRDPRSRVVEVPLDCRPCGKHNADRCPLGHFRCMRDITPGRVLEAAREVLWGLPVVAAVAAAQAAPAGGESCRPRTPA